MIRLMAAKLDAGEKRVDSEEAVWRALGDMEQAQLPHSAAAKSSAATMLQPDPRDPPPKPYSILQVTLSRAVLGIIQQQRQQQSPTAASVAVQLSSADSPDRQPPQRLPELYSHVLHCAFACLEFSELAAALRMCHPWYAASRAMPPRPLVWWSP